MRFISRRLATGIAGVGILTAGGLTARAAQIVFPAFQDATLLGGSDATNNESLADPGLFVGTDGQDNPKRSLIEFNIQQAVGGQSIPAGSTITAVTLTMTIGQVAGGGGAAETISLFDESQAWGQPTNVAGAKSFGGTGHGGAAQNGDATWNDAFYNTTPASATAWTTAGGDWSSSLTDIADSSVTGTLAAFSWTSANMVTDVQSWLDSPSANFGWIIKNADETTATDFRAFWSAQGAAANSNPAIAPSLTVTFTPLPEPVGITTIAALAPFLLCRKRSHASMQ